MNWENGSAVSVRMDGETAVISANREGLLSLAALCAELAENAPGSHYHLDPYNSLEDDSTELIIEKIP